MPATRRHFLYASASTAAASQSLALQPDPAPAPLSRSVLSATEASVHQLRTEARARRMTARSVRRAHTSLSIFFDHMDETGHTAHIERLAKEKGLLDQPLDYQQLTLLRDRYTAATGNAVSDAQFQALVQNNDVMWPTFHALHKKGGFRAVHNQILAGLENGASRIEKDTAFIGIPRERLGGAHLRTVQDVVGENCGTYGCSTQADGSTGWNLCASIGLMGIYAGTWGVMDALAVVSVFAIGAVGWALTGLFFAAATFICM